MKAGLTVTRSHDQLMESVGGVPKLATLEVFDGNVTPESGRKSIASRAAKAPGKINLVPVFEALIAAGVDPAAEMIKIIKGQVMVTDRSGEPVKDADGLIMMVDAVDADTKLRVLSELLSYTQPKLKAVEMRVSGHLELSNEQLDSRLAALMAKAIH